MQLGKYLPKDAYLSQKTIVAGGFEFDTLITGGPHAEAFAHSW
jgi:hypothetical protein